MYGDTKTGDAKYPMTPVKHDLIVGGPSARRRDAPMRGIKIPQQEFALKCSGGAYARGGVFAGHYGKKCAFHPPTQYSRELPFLETDCVK